MLLHMGKKDFAKVIKDLKMGRFSWVCSMGGKRVRERRYKDRAEVREERQFSIVATGNSCRVAVMMKSHH